MARTYRTLVLFIFYSSDLGSNSYLDVYEQVKDFLLRNEHPTMLPVTLNVCQCQVQK